jgi:hypothetical protein
MLKKIFLGLAALFVVAQFIRPEKNLSSAPPDKDDFVLRFAPPPEVKKLLEAACYDCHSANTHYPWYAEIQPTGWWLKRHVDEGKNEFNFSVFGSYSEKRQVKKMSALIDVISDRTMPLPSYTWIHRDAIFTEAQIKTLTTWLEAQQEKLGGEK